MSTPDNLKYTKSHEWVQDMGDGTVRIGITDHAQEALGDLVYVEVPEVGVEYDQGAECAVVESVKAASDVYAPVSGEVIEGNALLADEPEKINDDPYGDGWMFAMKLADDGELVGLLDAAAYQEVLDNED